MSTRHGGGHTTLGTPRSYLRATTAWRAECLTDRSAVTTVSKSTCKSTCRGAEVYVANLLLRGGAKQLRETGVFVPLFEQGTYVVESGSLCFISFFCVNCSK